MNAENCTEIMLSPYLLSGDKDICAFRISIIIILSAECCTEVFAPTNKWNHFNCVTLNRQLLFSPQGPFLISLIGKWLKKPISLPCQKLILQFQDSPLIYYVSTHNTLFSALKWVEFIVNISVSYPCRLCFWTLLYKILRQAYCHAEAILPYVPAYLNGHSHIIPLWCPSSFSVLASWTVQGRSTN